jgi:formate dehydrogenase subunit gamma
VATAATPTSNPEAVAGPALVPRFGRTERVLHWVHAAGFFGMLASGLVLFLPSLSAAVGDRPTVKAVHLGVAAAWLTALALVSVGGDRRALRRTRREIEAFRDDDVRWLRGGKAAQGRFNAGQKSHTVAQAALAALFVLSGALLWLGERGAAFRLPGTVALHDAATFFASVLVLGHLFLSLVWPATRPALRGIVSGSVPADWARRHHAAWRPASPEPARGIDRRRLAACAAILVLGGAGTVLLARSSLEPAAQRRLAAEPPLRPGADTLAIQAQAAVQAGQLPEAAAYLQQAIRQAPRRASLHVALGDALAQAGDLPRAEAELERAVALAPQAADAHLLLGAIRVSDGRRAAGRAELRTALRLAPSGANAAQARRLLRGP